jgi:hypothetical protein
MSYNPIRVQQYLSGIEYPAIKQDLIEHANREGADFKVIEALEDLPNRDYRSPSDVSEELGKLES